MASKVKSIECGFCGVTVMLPFGSTQTTCNGCFAAYRTGQEDAANYIFTCGHLIGGDWAARDAAALIRQHAREKDAHLGREETDDDCDLVC